MPATLLGSTVGLISGLLPGFGNLLGMIVLFPFIAHWSPVNIFVCYAALTMLSQFVGSLTSLYTGVPGEASSMPTVLESKHLPASALPETVAATAVGSAAAGLIATALCIAVVPQMASISWFYRTEVIASLLAVATVLVVTLDPQKRLVATCLLVVGIVLGSVGWNNIMSLGILTFGIPDLYRGIPLDLTMVFLFALPQLTQKSCARLNPAVSCKLVRPRVPILSTVGHSLLGFVGGLVPGMTTVLSSQLSYAVSSWRTKDPYYRILASETANNAGAISQLLPMLIIGLPLVASEALTLSMMETRGFLASPELAAGILTATAPFFIIAVLIGLVCAWPLAARVLAILQINNQVFRATMLCALLLLVYVQAYNDHMLWFYLVASAVLAPIGWAIRRLDTTSLIFGFFISDRMWDHGSRIINLYY